MYSSLAQAQLAVSETDYFATDIPLVLSASRLKQTAKDAPVAITVIDRAMIEASGFTEIPDLLRLVPGFFVEYDSGHIQAAGYHLLESRYVRQQQILIDGRSVYTPILGGIPWTDLPITLDDIERIEVIRGPNAVTYGSNSFLGVINIITRHAVLDHGSSVKTNLGTHQLHEVFLRHGDTRGNLDYRLNLAYRQDDGFTDRYDGKIVRLFNTRLDYQFNKHNDISFQAGYNEGPREEDNTLSTAIPNHPRTVTSQFQQIRWEQTSSSDEAFHLQIYHNLLQENKTYTRTDFPITFDEGTRAERFDIELQKTAKPNSDLRYLYGLSYRLDRVNSELFFATTEPLDSRYKRLFGQVEYQITHDQLINLGLMIEDNSITGTNYSPRVSYNARITNTDTLRLAMSQATRTPVMLEAFPNARITTPVYDQVFFNNGTVDSERITAYDLGIIGNRPEYNLHYDARFFYEDITGLIADTTITPYPDSDNEAAYFANVDDALIRGVELQFDWRPDHRALLHAGVSHIEINSNDIRGEYTQAAPINSLVVLGSYHFDNGFQTSMGIYHRSSMAPLTRKSGDPELMPASTRIDTRVAKYFRTNTQRHTVAIVLQNLFDETYFSRLNNVIDRRAYLSYKIEF